MPRLEVLRKADTEVAFLLQRSAAGRIQHLPGLLLRRSGQRHPRVFGDKREKKVPPAERHKKNRRGNKEKNL